MIIGLYQKLPFILFSLIGAFFIIRYFLVYFNIIVYNNSNIFDLIAGFLLSLLPFLIAIMAIRQFNSNPSFSKPITYHFNEIGIIVQGGTFKGEFVWQHIQKFKEIGKYLILYHSKRTGNYVDITSLNLEQLKFIKSKIGKVHSAANTR